MKKSIVIGMMMAALTTAGAWAETGQQNRMKSCNDEAGKKHLAGDARKDFMQSCLSGADGAKAAKPAKPVGTSSDDKPLTAQQQRMKDCNAKAKSKELKGDPRSAFMKSCLSNKK